MSQDRTDWKLAEGEGIRTPIRFPRIHAFQACALNHSATPPEARASGMQPRRCGVYNGSAALRKDSVSKNRRGGIARMASGTGFGSASARPCESPDAHPLAPRYAGMAVAVRVRARYRTEAKDAYAHVLVDPLSASSPERW